MNDKLLQIFVELPKFAGSLQGISPDTPFVEKLSYVLMEMADCADIPDNLNDPLLERLFKEADTRKMEDTVRQDYMKSIIGEADYEAQLYDWREEGLTEGRAEGEREGISRLIRKMMDSGADINTLSAQTGLTSNEILDLLDNQ